MTDILLASILISIIYPRVRVWISWKRRSLNAKRK